MSLPAAYFGPAPAVFRGGNVANFAYLNPLLGLGRMQASATPIRMRTESIIEASTKKPVETFQSVPQQTSFEERIFDSLVSLKVAVSQYAMHLPPEERGRIFSRLDSVINVDDWHEEDQLPLLQSFQNFLKWIVFARRFDWSSIGVSNEGNILIAWSRPKLALTANFSTGNKITWTATVDTEIGPAHAVGTCTLQYFTRQSIFYLDDAGGV